MAKVSLKAEEIVASLAETSKKVAKAKAWAKKKKGVVRLEIPEPYDHAAEMGPEKQQHCLGRPRIDQCGDLGVLMGVLKAIRRT